MLYYVIVYYNATNKPIHESPASTLHPSVEEMKKYSINGALYSKVEQRCYFYEPVNLI